MIQMLAIATRPFIRSTLVFFNSAIGAEEVYIAGTILMIGEQ